MEHTDEDLQDGIWTMTDTEFKEALREAKEQGWEQGWSAGAGWPQIEDNPYKQDPK